MDNWWIASIGEYVVMWPIALLLLVLYIVGIVMALLHYKSWVKRGLYVIALSVSMSVLASVLQLIKLA